MQRDITRAVNAFNAQVSAITCGATCVPRICIHNIQLVEDISATLRTHPPVERTCMHDPVRDCLKLPSVFMRQSLCTCRTGFVTQHGHSMAVYALHEWIANLSCKPCHGHCWRAASWTPQLRLCGRRWRFCIHVAILHVGRIRCGALVLQKLLQPQKFTPQQCFRGHAARMHKQPRSLRTPSSRWYPGPY